MQPEYKFHISRLGLSLIGFMKKADVHLDVMNKLLSLSNQLSARHSYKPAFRKEQAEVQVKE